MGDYRLEEAIIIPQGDKKMSLYEIINKDKVKSLFIKSMIVASSFLVGCESIPNQRVSSPHTYDKCTPIETETLYTIPNMENWEAKYGGLTPYHNGRW